MHRCADVVRTIDDLVNCKNSSKEQKEHRPRCSIKDSSDYNKFLEWFKEHNRYECNEKMVVLDISLVDV